MVDFRDRRNGQPDFNDGSDHFSMTTAGDAEHDQWGTMANDAKAKRVVGAYYKGQKDTQTWHEANRLAAKRAQRTSDGEESASDYAYAYEDHLARVLSTKGATLAKQHGEVQPGR